MKKLIIATAAIVGLGLSFVNAAEVKVDFDGELRKGQGLDRTPYYTSVDKILKVNGIEVPIPVPAKDIKQLVLSDKSMDSSILDATKYCEKSNIDIATTQNLKKLLTYGTKAEKNEFLNVSKYRFPERFNELREVNFTSYSLSTKEVGVCLSWTTTQVCRDKEVWQTACILGSVVCYAAAGAACGPAGAVCSLINRVVNECVSVPYCAEYGEVQGYPGIPL